MGELPRILWWTRDLYVTLTIEVMAMPSKKTAVDRYFDARMKNPEFAAAYRDERAIIDSTDTLIRLLDEARALDGVSKADLARKMEARPEIVRRLFTAKDSNPTLVTILKLVAALGFRLELVPNRDSAAPAAP